MKIKQYLVAVFSILFILTINKSFAQITLKASHQFPGGKGDARDEMVQILAKEVEKANVGVKIQVYPGQSLYKAMEQYKPLTRRSIRYYFFTIRLCFWFSTSIQCNVNARLS